MDGSRRGLPRPRGRRGSRVTATADTQLVSPGGSAILEKWGERTALVRILSFVGISGGGAASCKIAR